MRMSLEGSLILQTLQEHAKATQEGPGNLTHNLLTVTMAMGKAMMVFLCFKYCNCSSSSLYRGHKQTHPLPLDSAIVVHPRGADKDARN